MQAAHVSSDTSETLALEEWKGRLFGSIDRGDAAGFVSFLSEDAVFRYGSGAEVHGREAIRAFVAGVFSGFGACAHDVRSTWAIGSRRICEGMVTYRLPDGTHVSLPFCNVLTMRGELIERYQIYIDPTPMLVADRPPAPRDSAPCDR